MASKVLSGLCSIEPFVISLLNLNVVVQTPMTVNVLPVQLKEVVTPENIKIVHKLIICDGELKLREIAEIVQRVCNYA